MKKYTTYLNAAGLLLSFLVCSCPIHAAENDKESSVPEMKMDHSAHKESQSPTIKVDVLPLHTMKKGEAQIVKIKLSSLTDDKEVLLSDLKTAHTKKIHVLIFDASLTDYQHVHPEPTAEKGIYQFDWTPKNEGAYRLWVDVVPLKTGQEEYIRAELETVGTSSKRIEKIISLSEKVGDNGYTLSFDAESLKKGQAVMGTIKVVDAEGHDFKALEPIMGAYAHIVAINEDFETIAHVHPMGEDPSKEDDRGGPLLKFHFEPEKSGYYKIWLQVAIDGKDTYVPFGVRVE
ncbi:MAG: hypothetical protein ACTHJ4_04425 [Candidatus Nucleicultricaceae bacterium]